MCFKQSVVRPDYVCTYAANTKLNRCWDDAGPASETLVQLWVNVLYLFAGIHVDHQAAVRCPLPTGHR